MTKMKTSNRLPLSDLAHAKPKITEALKCLPPEVSKLRIFRIMAHAENTFSPLLQFFTACFNNLELSHKYRELIILQTTKLSNFEYEWLQHIPIAKGLGITDDQIKVIEGTAAGENNFTEEEQLLLECTKQIVVDGNVSDFLFSQMVEKFSPRMIVELTEVIGGYMLMARIVMVSRLENDPPVQ